MAETIDQYTLQRFGHLEFIAKQVVEGFITGLHKSPFHGFSVEFAEHRAYNTGESIKHINWKLYGRTDKLFVKRYEEETNLRCQIVIDNSSSMYFPVKKKNSIDNPNKIIFSVYCAAALIYLFRKQKDAIGLSIFSDKIDLHTPAKSSPIHNKMLFYELEKMLLPISVDVHKKTVVTNSLHEIAEAIHKRSLVIIFSDMMESNNSIDELFAALQHLRYNKHEVILFHVIDKQKEIDFNFENRPYKFIDMESSEEIKVQTNEVKETYIKSITEYNHKLQLHCGKYKIDFVVSDINKGFYQVLLPYLLKREKMY